MQLSNTWKATVGLMIGAILCLPAQAAAEKKIIMRYSHSSAAMVEEPHHTAALDFKKYVEEKTKGWAMLTARFIWPAPMWRRPPPSRASSPTPRRCK